MKRFGVLLLSSVLLLSAANRKGPGKSTGGPMAPPLNSPNPENPGPIPRSSPQPLPPGVAPANSDQKAAKNKAKSKAKNKDGRSRAGAEPEAKH